eukprot:1394716-Amorphochlora_amoeboformis.AAC.1
MGLLERGIHNHANSNFLPGDILPPSYLDVYRRASSEKDKVEASYRAPLSFPPALYISKGWGQRAK